MIIARFRTKKGKKKPPSLAINFSKKPDQYRVKFITNPGHLEKPQCGKQQNIRYVFQHFKEQKLQKPGKVKTEAFRQHPIALIGDKK